MPEQSLRGSDSLNSAEPGSADYHCFFRRTLTTPGAAGAAAVSRLSLYVSNEKERLRRVFDAEFHALHAARVAVEGSQHDSS